MTGLDHWFDRHAVAIAARGEAPSSPQSAVEELKLNSLSRSDMFAEMLQSSTERLPGLPDRAPAMLPAENRRATRSTVLKAAAALIVLVGLPAARPKPAKAEGSGECKEKCFDEYGKALAERVQACSRRFSPQAADPGRTLHFLFRYAPVNLPFKVICNEWVLVSSADEGRACNGRCDEQNKPKPPSRVCSAPSNRRSSQPLERAEQCASFPPPPPNLHPPTITPPPDDGCSNCTQVGGVCCGSPTPGAYICACAAPGYDCCTTYSCCG
jgi:hypothetical protein